MTDEEVFKARGKASWIETFTGRKFTPFDPKPEDIDIRDIAHSLSLQTRYNGHCPDFYSVAEHSVRVAKYVAGKLKGGNIPTDPCLALRALLHDASEAYLCDIPRPVKPFLTNYAEIEAKLQTAIYRRFGCDAPDLKTQLEWDAIIKDADNRLLSTEVRSFRMNRDNSWTLTAEPLAKDIIPMDVKQSEREFLDEFQYWQDRVQ